MRTIIIIIVVMITTRNTVTNYIRNVPPRYDFEPPYSFLLSEWQTFPREFAISQCEQLVFIY